MKAYQSKRLPLGIEIICFPLTLEFLYIVVQLLGHSWTLLVFSALIYDSYLSESASINEQEKLLFYIWIPVNTFQLFVIYHILKTIIKCFPRS